MFYKIYNKEPPEDGLHSNRLIYDLNQVTNELRFNSQPSLRDSFNGP